MSIKKLVFLIAVVMINVSMVDLNAAGHFGGPRGRGKQKPESQQERAARIRREAAAAEAKKEQEDVAAATAASLAASRRPGRQVPGQRPVVPRGQVAPRDLETTYVQLLERAFTDGHDVEGIRQAKESGALSTSDAIANLDELILQGRPVAQVLIEPEPRPVAPGGPGMAPGDPEATYELLLGIAERDMGLNVDLIKNLKVEGLATQDLVVMLRDLIEQELSKGEERKHREADRQAEAIRRAQRVVDEPARQERLRVNQEAARQREIREQRQQAEELARRQEQQRAQEHQRIQELDRRDQEAEVARRRVQDRQAAEAQAAARRAQERRLAEEEEKRQQAEELARRQEQQQRVRVQELQREERQRVQEQQREALAQASRQADERERQAAREREIQGIINLAEERQEFERLALEAFPESTLKTIFAGGYYKGLSGQAKVDYLKLFILHLFKVAGSGQEAVDKMWEDAQRNVAQRRR